jgi:hypothetical protein
MQVLLSDQCLNPCIALDKSLILDLMYVSGIIWIFRYRSIRLRQKRRKTLLFPQQYAGDPAQRYAFPQRAQGAGRVVCILWDGGGNGPRKASTQCLASSSRPYSSSKEPYSAVSKARRRGAQLLISCGEAQDDREEEDHKRQPAFPLVRKVPARSPEKNRAKLS